MNEKYKTSCTLLIEDLGETGPICAAHDVSTEI